MKLTRMVIVLLFLASLAGCIGASLKEDLKRLGCMSDPNRDAPSNESFCDKPPANTGADSKGTADA